MNVETWIFSQAFELRKTSGTDEKFPAGTYYVTQHEMLDMKSKTKIKTGTCSLNRPNITDVTVTYDDLLNMEKSGLAQKK